MIAAMHTAARYTLFALVATLANIGAQDVALRVYAGPRAVGVSVLVGTVVGLVVKYVLDKKYIFHFQTDSAMHDGRVFAFYTLLGVATTGVFWGFEFGFDYLFDGAKAMRYTGGVIGLAIGYTLKYHLDKRYVFVARPGRPGRPG